MNESNNFFYDNQDHIKKEKQKAKDLRKTQWWKNKCHTGLCHYCARQFDPSEITMDHIVPLSKGGRSEKNNIIPCCKECNNKKKNLLTFEWEDYK
jgi:5-methylcytosine-specific restriction endonuclease McrA